MNINRDAIPEWDDYGLIPSFEEAVPTSLYRSPYTVSILHLVARFGNTEPRRRLLTGPLNFRAELNRADITQGFQWIDGSFVENVEVTRDRSPADIDVVTFYYTPDGHT